MFVFVKREFIYLADYVIFMYLSEVIEHVPAEEVLNNPRETRTRAYLHREF
jgi:phosphate transport system ATP-binding protein